MKKPIRILLADDHTLVRAGIRALLQGMPDVEVVAESGDGQEALRLAHQHQPDVVLMDIAMTNLNGIEAAARVRKEIPDVHVIMLSMHANEEYVMRALQAGVAGYLLKDSAATELELAVKAVARGETYLSPAVSTHVISYMRRVKEREAAEPQAASYPADDLTPRQREILQLIAEGKTTKDIAALLHLSVKTVETHRAQLMDRLDIHDIAGLVRHAIRIGLVSVE
ncbi:MAG: response regulator [Candidatus Binatia bacterium]